MSDGISKMYDLINDLNCAVNEIVHNKLGFMDFNYKSNDIALSCRKPVTIMIEKGHYIVFNHEETGNKRLVTSGESKQLGNWYYYVST